VETLGEPSGEHGLAWSPDGHWLAYTSGNWAWEYSSNVVATFIRVVRAEGGSPQTISPYQHLNVSPAWLDARHLLFVSDRDGPLGLYAAEVGRGGRGGQPRAIPGVSDPHSISYASATRTLAFAKFGARQNIWSYPLGRSTPISIRDGHPVTTGTQLVETHDVSPDGKWIVYSSNLRGNMDLYRMPVGGGRAVPLTDVGEAPRWSPDGREIAYQHFDAADTTVNVYVIPAAGGAPVRALGPGMINVFPRWSPDGLALLVASFPRGGVGLPRERLATRDSVGGAWHEPVTFSDGEVELGRIGEWAPDGSGVLETWGSPSVLELRSRDGRVVWRRDLTATAGLTVLPNRFPFARQYSRDGGTIYLMAAHRDGRRGIWAVPVAGAPPRLVVAFDDPAIAWTDCLSVGPDALYLTVTQFESDIWVAKLRY
jgi:hypothetical protein